MTFKEYWFWGEKTLNCYIINYLGWKEMDNKVGDWNASFECQLGSPILKARWDEDKE